MDLIFNTFLKGLIIGTLVSAPMGPIGMLVIQRALNKGRKAGLVTGLGASLSDLIYAIASGFGISVILTFIEANSTLFQGVGSCVILLFAAYLWRKNPLDTVTSTQLNSSSYTKYFASGFFLTLSNPMIIFFFMALYARTDFFKPLQSLTHYLIAFMSIALGAFLWWIFITWVIEQVRDYFKMKGLFIFNKIVAIVMGILALVGLLSVVINLV